MFDYLQDNLRILKRLIKNYDQANPGFSSSSRSSLNVERSVVAQLRDDAAAHKRQKNAVLTKVFFNATHKTHKNAALTKVFHNRIYRTKMETKKSKYNRLVDALF